MNCEKCQDLISDFLDGALSHEDQSTLNAHLEECLSCAGVRDDLQSIVGFCRTHRGEYTAPPNEKALWLRIRNMIEAGAGATVAAPAPARRKIWSKLRQGARQLGTFFPAAGCFSGGDRVGCFTFDRCWLASLARKVERLQLLTRRNANMSVGAANVRDRISQQQQLISYWNQRVEFNKARWSPQMRETFDRNLKVIDQAVNDSFDALSQNPHDEVSEEMLNAALNEKLSLLKEFAEL